MFCYTCVFNSNICQLKEFKILLSLFLNPTPLQHGLAGRRFSILPQQSQHIYTQRHPQERRLQHWKRKQWKQHLWSPTGKMALKIMVQLYLQLKNKESWALKNWYFCFFFFLFFFFLRIDTFELWCWRRLLKSPLDCKEIKPVNPKGNQSWTFIGRTDAEAPIFWPPDSKNWLIGKEPKAGKDL